MAHRRPDQQAARAGRPARRGGDLEPALLVAVPVKRDIDIPPVAAHEWPVSGAAAGGLNGDY
jgi:hypothetical protein